MASWHEDLATWATPLVRTVGFLDEWNSQYFWDCCNIWSAMYQKKYFLYIYFRRQITFCLHLLMESTSDTTKTMNMPLYFWISSLFLFSFVLELYTSWRSLIVFPTNYCNINKTILRPNISSHNSFVAYVWLWAHCLFRKSEYRIINIWFVSTTVMCFLGFPPKEHRISLNVMFFNTSHGFIVRTLMFQKLFTLPFNP